MALSATDLPALEQALTDNFFLTGNNPTATDNSIHGELLTNVPDSTAFPHVWSWFSFVNQFAPAVRNKWVAEGAGEEGEDDEFDLFADDPDAEEAAKKEAEARGEQKKAVPVGKSSVLFDIKPQYSSVDLDILAERIRAEIVVDGLKWTDEHKKIPVAFTIFKLNLGCVILDTVETEDLIDKIMAIEGEIEIDEEDDDGEPTGNKLIVTEPLAQSVDIATFQKIWGNNSFEGINAFILNTIFLIICMQLRYKVMNQIR